MNRIISALIIAPFCICHCAASDDMKMWADAFPNGTLSIYDDTRTYRTDFVPGLFDDQWRSANATGTTRKDLSMKTAGGVVVKAEASFKHVGDGIQASYSFVPTADVKLNSLNVSGDFPVNVMAGTKWKMDDVEGVFPMQHKDTALKSAKISKLKLEPKGSLGLTLTFDEPTDVLIQDNRQWNTSSFAVRIGLKGEFKKDQPQKINFKISGGGRFGLREDGPVTIVAGPDWIPLKTELDIEPGSALDFSKMNLTDAPAGKYGRVICRDDGQFVFENERQTPRRFYGVNLCFGAQYLTHEESDKLAERFARIGYNALRIHHYEGTLTEKGPSTELNAERADQLDYLIAAMARRGIYTTTDLFVSRPVKFKDIGIDKPGNVGMDEFKIMVPVHEGAYNNWKTFSKNFLDHTNKYSGKRNADDPALAWLAMINEGNFGNFTRFMKNIPEWKTAWNAWLKSRYSSREALAKEWGAALKDDEDQTKESVAAPQNVYGGNTRARDENIFLAEKEREMVEKMTRFLREEIKCAALISNSSAWTNHAVDQYKRMVYDYIDDHFYVDHPKFLQGDWRLPSRCDNTSPIAGGATGGRTCAFTRIFGKPFTLTEYNYSAPGRFRGVGGILTGAMGALQGWSGIWRFAYAHDKSYIFKPAKIDYFDMACDPLGQAAERASICLFLRGDMKTAPRMAEIIMPEESLRNPREVPKLAAPWHWAAWVTRIGTNVLKDRGEANRAFERPLWLDVVGNADEEGGKSAAPDPYQVSSSDVVEVMRKKKILDADNPTDPAKNIYRSETGEITIDAPADKMILDTPRTAGGYARAGERIDTKDGTVQIEIKNSDATVWVSALDDKPIAKSKRLIVTHLTDLQNTEIKYAESGRKTLLDWGKMPHLVRNGKAIVRIKLENPERFEVFALSTGGRRLAAIKSAIASSALEFDAEVAAGPDESARMIYEIVAK